MQWTLAFPAILAALAVILLPGVALTYSLGLRGLTAIALSPALSVSLIAVAAVVTPWIGLRFGLPPVLGLGLLACGAAIGSTWLLNRRRIGALAVPPRPAGWLAAISVLLGAALVGIPFMYAVGDPSHISQTYDNIFHLNAIAYIEDTGQASSFTLGQLTGIPFYPAGWHAFAALVRQIAGVSIPVGVNAANLLIAAMVWPLGIIYLCRQITGRRAALLPAGVLSAAFGAFPLMMTEFGVLYPYLLAIALLPSTLAVGINLLKLSKVGDMSTATCVSVLGLALPGLALAHPSILMALIAMLTLPAVMRFVAGWTTWRRDWSTHRRTAIRCIVALSVYLIIAGFLWVTVRPEESAAFWPPIHSIVGSLLGIIGNSEIGLGPSVLVSVFALVGLIVVLRRRDSWWVAAMYAVPAILYVVVSAFSPGRVRTFLTGIWYNDSYRLAALLPTAGAVVAVIGTLWTVDKAVEAARHRGRMSSIDRPLVRRVVAGLGLIVLAVFTQTGGVSTMVEKTRSTYALTDQSPLLTSDEMRMLNQVDGLVPPDAVIAGNPANGSSLAYALAHRKVLQAHVLGNISYEQQLIEGGLGTATPGSPVCHAVRDLHVGYVLDFGSQEVNNGNHAMPGLTDLAVSPAVKLVKSIGQARLYQVVGCP